MKSNLKISPSDYRRLSDEELIRRYSELHEYLSMNYIFERYGHIVFGICLRNIKNVQAAKALMEEIFCKMFDGFLRHTVHDFNPSGFKSWLLNFVNSYCLLKTGNENRIIRKFEEEVYKTAPNLINPQKNIEIAMTRLSPEQRECIDLFYLKNKNYVDVAQETGYSIEQIKWFLYSGKQILASDFETYIADL